LAAKAFKIEALDAHTSWLTIERELPLEVNSASSFFLGLRI